MALRSEPRRAEAVVRVEDVTGTRTASWSANGTGTDAAILRVEDLTVSFSGFKALNGLNFSMQPGELRVVIGPNGAGKTTLLDVITGKTRPRSGRVLFRGDDITRLPEQ